MNSVKIGTLVIAGMFAVNGIAQTEEAKPRGERIEKNAPEKREQMTPEQQAKQQTERIDKKLNLSEDQKSRIYDINLKVNQKNAVVKASKDKSKKFKKDSFKGNNESRMYLIRESLTEEQKVIWDKLQAEKAAKKAEKKETHEKHDHNHEGHSH